MLNTCFRNPLAGHRALGGVVAMLRFAGRASSCLLAVVAVAGAGLALAPSAWVQAAQANDFAVGQVMSRKQLQALGALDRVEIDQRSYRVLRRETAANGLPVTTLVDRRGLVGQSHNELLITGQPTDVVRKRAATLLASASQVKYYAHMDVTFARFPTLEQAIAVQAQVRAVLPDAKVSVPVTFEKPRLK